MSSPSKASCLAVLVLGVVSCRSNAPGGDRDDHRAGASPISSAPAPAPIASARTQLDLARELAATEQTADQGVSLHALRERWQGKRLTWTVTRQAMLCRTPDACHVVPFPAPRPADANGHGWLPTLELAPGQWDRLLAACGDAAMCELRFEGDLVELAVSTDTPTSLRFANVSVVTATSAIALSSRTGG